MPKAGGITVDVKPDFSAFRTPTVEHIMKTVGVDEPTAQRFLESYTVLPG